MSAPTPPGLSASTAVKLVAWREITTRYQGKAYRVSTLILAAALVAIVLLLHFLSGGSDTTKVAVAGADGSSLSQGIVTVAKASGKTYEAKDVADAETAKNQVADDTVKAALVIANGTYTVYFKKADDPEVRAILQSAATTYAIEKGLSASELAKLRQATTSSQLVTANTTPKKDHEAERITIAYIAVALLSIAIMFGGQTIAQGVVEEKASRVVEILLATIRPIQLLWGKIIGCGVLAVAQLLFAAVAGLIAALAVGELNVGITAWGVLGLSLVWFFLGFLFFATLFAGAGALVSRQEDIGSVTVPITMLAMVMMYAGIFGVQFPDAGWVKIISYIPPFAATVQPMLLATGHLTLAQAIVPIILALVLVAGTVLLSARMYRNSVLRTGAKVKWSEALKA